MKRSSVRIPLLPTLIAACVVALVMRIGGWSAPLFEAVAATAEETGSEDSGESTAEDDSHSGESEKATCAPASPDDEMARDSGLSKHEIQVLRSLSARRRTLDERAAEIETRTAAAAAAELRLGGQIGELKRLQSEIAAELEAMQIKRDERLDGLVKIYESMKAKDAARIFDALDDRVLLKMGVRMKHANLAAIMAKMNADRARLLTGMLAEAA